jgi:hypothetical protein
VQRLSRWIVTGWAQVFLDNGLVVRFLIRRGVSPRSARGMAAWIVPLLLSSVFVILFAFANPIIAEWISRFGDWLGRMIEHLPDVLNIARVLFWLAFAAGGWMLLRGRVRRWRTERRDADHEVDAFIEHRSARLYVPVAFVVRCLLLFNVIFAVQNVLDAKYLYTPAKILPNGMTDREYVRRGAYPLVGAALLAGAFVLITFRPNSETESSPSARKLVYAWIGQTIVLTGSAAWRLKNYIDLTELTRLRVASAVWFLLVGLGLFYIIWRIVRGRSNAWLVNVNALTALLVLYPCCFINFDGYIADFNARHCQEAGGDGITLDIEYMRDLGTPALAALDSVRGKIALEPRRKFAERVSNDLHTQLDTELSDWHSWTWRRSRCDGQHRGPRISWRSSSRSRASASVAAQAAGCPGDGRHDVASGRRVGPPHRLPAPAGKEQHRADRATAKPNRAAAAAFGPVSAAAA